MKNLILLFVILNTVNLVFSQGGVGVGTNAPHASAKLEVSSTTQGMLIPRMTTGQRTMIASPATGLLVFDITSNSFWFRNSNSWVELRDSVNTEVHRNGPNRIYMGMTANVGIGTVLPNAPLQFASVEATRKIVLYEGGNNDNQYFGFGINSSALRYQAIGDHVFYYGENATTSHELMRIKYGGNVGINVSNPLNKFDIQSGPARSGFHASGRGLYVTGDLYEASNGVEFRHYNGTQGIGFGYNTIYATGTDVDQNLGIKAKGTIGNVILSTNEMERMRVTGDGRVGIGTTNPNATLEIARGTAPNGSLWVNGTSSSSHFNFGTSEDTYIRGGKPAAKVFINEAAGLGNVIIGTKLGLGNAVPSGWLQFPSETDSRKIVMWSGGDNNHEFYGFGVNASILRYQVSNVNDNHVFYAGNGSAASNELVRIKGNGNVGIGTPSPNAPLQFGNTDANRKIVLKEYFDNDHQYYGLGTGALSLRYQTGTIFGDHIFYAATSSSTSDELFRIKGTGNVAVKGIIESEAWQLAPLINGYTGTPGWPDPSFYKDKLGVVHLRGWAKVPNPFQNAAVFYLPQGYWPDGTRQYSLSYGGSTTNAVVVIGDNGSVLFYNVQATLSYGLDQISFRAN